MEQILDAATTVFADVGLERGTTNAIAAEAGISPGSLYQYFADKQAIATALWQRYADRLQAAHAPAPEFDPMTASLAELTDRLIDPAFALKVRHRDFAKLLAHADGPGLERIQQTNTEFEQRIQQILRRRNPDLPSATVANCTAMVFAIFHSAVSTAEPITGDTDTDLAELKAATLAYLAVRGIR